MLSRSFAAKVDQDPGEEMRAQPRYPTRMKSGKIGTEKDAFQDASSTVMSLREF